MRLFTRLILSHLAPLLVITCALALTLAALVRMTAVLDALGEDELETLRTEGDLHHAAWVLEVSLRHRHDDCVAQRHLPIRERIQEDADALRVELRHARETTPAMKDVVARYLALADDLLEARDTCAMLATVAYQERRDRLDEELTTLWVARLDELHAEVTRKEDEARRLGGTAAVVGVILAVAALLIAAWVARRLTRSVNRSLTALAELTRRVGHGDFSTAVVVHGPREIVGLADELERMRLQLRQLEAFKQGILASISHELRTPLSKIREALALLADGVVGPIDPRQERVVQIARDACEREIRLVTTLLDLSRLRAGSPIRVLAGSSLDHVVERALDDEREEAESQGVEVQLELVGPTPHLALDPVLLERAIANLVRNAVAVSNRGQQVFVTRQVVERTAPVSQVSSGDGETGRWCCITVRDEGPGVPDEVRQTVFEAFVTRPVPRSPKRLGFGIGLALAREVARAHGGELELDEECEVGATFRLWLPEEHSNESDASPRTLGLASGGQAQRSARHGHG